MKGAFEIALSEDDLVAAFRLNARLGRTRPLFLIVLVLVLLLGLILFASPQARWSATSRPLTLMLEGAVLLAALLLLAAMLAIGPVWRLAARRSLAQRTDLTGPIRYAFSEESLLHSTTYSQSNYPWKAFYGWREDDRTILIFISAQLFYPIPISKVEPAILAALRAALIAAEVPRR